MKREWCLLSLIAVLLIVSFLIPESSYSPPPAEFVERNFPVYEERPARSAYVECALYTRSYYHYVVDWVLSYPHDHGFSRPGYFRTVIVVRDWESFVKDVPHHCEILEVNDLDWNDPLYSASLRLKNVTAGTEDYVKLEPFFTYAGYRQQPTGNWTRVHVTVFTDDVREQVKLPFLAVWVGVVALSLLGVLLNIKGNKILIAGFIALLVIGALFVGEYIKNEHGIAEREQTFKELLALNSTGGECGMTVAGVSADFKSKEDVSWFLTTLKRENSSISSVRWEDYTVRISVATSFNSYKILLDEFGEKGWEVSTIELDPSAFHRPQEEIKKINDTIQTLLKYLPLLPDDERKVVEEYVENLNETIRRDVTKGQGACVEVIASTPEAFVYNYAGYSDFLAKFALLVTAIMMVVAVRR
ncbi:hypothetical protein NF865_10350 [Thermococcus aggregans]|uniref:Uncharacterized protein n=1 Tax=Thermococcus aggregans TaxID=110163 RepID=A0A9E7SNT7_THEAG|nr:hypothetical protein [Thermococcus aggregans]USS40661.1 hypothetical protein NF865_10350 [Thermococcus aggregans]